MTPQTKCSACKKTYTGTNLEEEFSVVAMCPDCVLKSVETKQQAPKSKNAEKLASFTAYCKEHPSDRFMQAVRNWLRVDYLYSQTGCEPIKDTFYDE